MTRAIVARAPTRLDFGGGWTDVPPYTEREGGAVCNVAITRYATATVSIGAAHPSNSGAAHPADDSLIIAALKRAGASGVEAHVANDFPIGAGLGGSSAAGVALAGALADLRGQPLGAMQLAALSRDTEVTELGIAGGYQDHYAAAFGGALLLHFDTEAHVERIVLPDECADAIARRGIVLYTGESRISGNTITAVRDAWLAGDRRVVDALARMKSLAVEMANALRRGDLDTLGALIGEHWVHQRALHPAITTERIDAIARVASNAGAIGMKALGASGGGCVLAFAAEGREEELASALAPLGERLEYAVDTQGYQVVARMEMEVTNAAADNDA